MGRYKLLVESLTVPYHECAIFVNSKLDVMNILKVIDPVRWDVRIYQRKGKGLPNVEVTDDWEVPF